MLKYLLSWLSGHVQADAQEEARLESLEKELQAAQKELSKVEGSMAGLRSQAEALNVQIEGAGGDALKKQRKQAAAAHQVCVHWMIWNHGNSFGSFATSFAWQQLTYAVAVSTAPAGSCHDVISGQMSSLALPSEQTLQCTVLILVAAAAA